MEKTPGHKQGCKFFLPNLIWGMVFLFLLVSCGGGGDDGNGNKPINHSPKILGVAIYQAMEGDYLSGKINASDEDEGECGELSYQIIPGNTLSSVEFIIAQATGEFQSKDLLSNGTVGANSIQVIVRDGCEGEASLVKNFNIEPLGIATEFRFSPARGAVQVLVILANFSNTTPSYGVSDFEQLFFGDGDTVNSVRNYYQKVSYGQLDITGEVIGWCPLSRTREYYGNNMYGRNADRYPRNLYKLTEEAIDWAESQGVDFSKYDNNGDGWVDSLVIIHQGPGGERTRDPYDIWSMVSALSYGGAQPRYYDNRKIEYFAIVPEITPQDTGIIEVGPLAHEYGHLLGMIDSYSWKYDLWFGLGVFDLMSYGVYGGDSKSPDQPVEPSVFNKLKMGWLEPMVISSGMTLNLPAIENEPYALKVPAGTDEREFFLITNQQKLGFDEKLPAEGIYIWHIDNASALQNTYRPPILGSSLDSYCNYSTAFSRYHHPMVSLEEADGKYDLVYRNNYGDEGDSWKSGQAFDARSNPINLLYDCSPSGIEIKVLGGSTVQIEFNKFQTNLEKPEFWIRDFQFQPVSGAGDGDEFPEPNESLDLKVKLFNSGTNATGITLQAGSTSPYIVFSSATSSYPDLASGDSAYNNSLIRIQFKETNAQEVPAKLKLTYTYKANSKTYSKTFSQTITIGKPAVLIVDDDGKDKAESVIQDAFKSSGYVNSNGYGIYGGDYSYTNWEVAEKGLPSLSYLQNHQAVIWLCGRQENPITNEELNLIKAYLDSGGKLILSCAYLLLNPSSGIEGFANQYLGISNWQDNGYAVQYIYGRTGSPISNGIISSSLNLINYYPLHHRTIGLIPDSQTRFAFTNTMGYPVMTQFSPPDSNYGVIFSSFGIEHIRREKLGIIGVAYNLLRRLLNSVLYQEGQPVILNCSPVSAQPRSKYSPPDYPPLTLELTGMNFSPETEFSFPEGNVHVVSKTYNSSTSYTLQVNVLYNAHPGYHKILAQNPDLAPAIYDRYFRVEGAPNPNTKPIAEISVAPGLYIEPGEAISLSGVNSYDLNGEPLTYQWEQLDGYPVEFLPSSTTDTVTIQTSGTWMGFYVFSLKVSDGNSISDADTVSIQAGDQEPVAIASAEPAQGGRRISYWLFGNQSYDPERKPLTYKWTQLSGSTVDLQPSDSDSVVAFQLPPNCQTECLGDYEFSLEVNDGVKNGTTTVMVRVINSPPIASAIADPEEGCLRTTFTLDASPSIEPDFDPLTYLWEQIEGATVLPPVDGSTAKVVSFKAPQDGIYSFRLTVSDDLLESDSTIVSVVVTNHPPVAIANATPETGNRQTVFTLDAFQSYDQDGDTISFNWTQIEGASVEIIPANTIEVSFSPAQDYAGIYRFQLTVSDTEPLDSSTVISVSVINQPPVARVSQSIIYGETNTEITLDGSLSYDPDEGDSLNYEWELIEGATYVEIIDHDSSIASFIPTKSGRYIFTLTVDDLLDTDSVTLEVNASRAENNPPIAIAGEDRIVDLEDGHSVCLDGTQSHPPVGDIAWGDTIRYQWVIISKPSSSSAVLDDPASPTPCFMDDKWGLYVIELRVMDSENVWSLPDEVKILSVAQDYDKDLMPDLWEIEHNLDPTNPADGALTVNSTTDPDGDGLVNVHEFFNQTNPKYPEPYLLNLRGLASPWNGGFFADADGDLCYGGTDYYILDDYLEFGDTSGYSQVYPPTAETQDLNGDAILNYNDLYILSELITGDDSNFTGRPYAIELIEPEIGDSIQVGKPARLRVQVKDQDGSPRSGSAVVFEVIKGDASLYGGEGTTPEKRLLSLFNEVYSSSAREYALVMSADELEVIFSSNLVDGATYFHLYQSTRSSVNEPFSYPAKITNLSQDGCMESGPSLSQDRKELFFYRCCPWYHPSYCTNCCDIYWATRPEPGSPFNNVSKVSTLSVNNYQDASPMLGPDQLTIYFASNRLVDGQNKRYDLWKAVRAQEGSTIFDNLENLSTINSKCYELFPAISPDQLQISFMSNLNPLDSDTCLWGNPIPYYLRLAERTEPQLDFSPSLPMDLVNLDDYDEYTPFFTWDGLGLFLALQLKSDANKRDIYFLKRAGPGLPFYINKTKGRYDLTGTMLLTEELNSEGKAMIYVRANQAGEIKIIVSAPGNEQRKIPDSALDQIITLVAE